MEIDFYISEGAFYKILSIVKNSSANQAKISSDIIEFSQKTSSTDCKSHEWNDGFILGGDDSECYIDDEALDFDENFDFLKNDSECSTSKVSNTEEDVYDHHSNTIRISEIDREQQTDQSSKKTKAEFEQTSGSDDKSHTLSLQEKYFKIGVIGGGCAGYSYDFAVVDQKLKEDVEISIANDTDEVKVLIDGMSVHLLSGCYLDYEENMIGSKFKIENPNACANCSCGSSFGV